MGTIALENAQTVEHLLAAYEGESNAAARYTAFAIRADADGWPGAASLFRAAARAEQIHAIHHARVIRQLGEELKCRIDAVVVKNTLENLKAALAGESYEVNSMYPGFLAEAGEHKNAAAIRTFTYALEAERTHARLFSEAIALVAAGKKKCWAANSRAFYVCPVCGFTSESSQEHEQCPVCSAAWARLEVIS